MSLINFYKEIRNKLNIYFNGDWRFGTIPSPYSNRNYINNKK